MKDLPQFSKKSIEKAAKLANKDQKKTMSDYREVEKLFDSFCLEGKISEGHAKDIKMLLSHALMKRKQIMKKL